MGAAFFIRRAVLNKIGFLDEKFFTWFEEVDYCQRAKKHGFIIKYFPEVSIIHQGGSSFQKQLAFQNQKILACIMKKDSMPIAIISLILPYRNLRPF